MRVRDRVGLNTSPLFLRIMLGGVLLWMGLGKILDTFEVQGSSAAILANMGVIKPATPSSSTQPPSTQPPATPSPAAPATPPEPGAAPDKSGGSTSLPPSIIHLASQTTPATTAPQYRSVDFPNPVKVRKLYTIALTIKSAAEPGATPSGAAKSPYWPKALAEGEWPVYLAWGSALGESLSGVGLMLGLLTRWWALLMAGRMLAAIWITQIGPAMEMPDAIFGFLPAYDTFDYEKWRPLALHFALMMSALALLFLGPGRASLDHAIFAKPSADDDED